MSKKENKEVDEKITELTNDLQRTRADFENYRKQVETQKEYERKRGKVGAILKILPLLDNIDRAMVTYPEELAPLKKSLEQTLKEMELEKVPSEEGAEFNPDLFEAVMVEGDGEKEVVAETLVPGYRFEGDLVRSAMVKVKKM